MGSWSRGFQAAQKSFGLVRKNKAALWYVIIACVCFAALVFGFLSLQFSQTATLNLLLESYGNKFITIAGILLAIPLIYISLHHLNIKHPRFTLTTFVWLILWIAIEAVALYIITVYFPANKETWDFTTLVSFIYSVSRFLTYYVLSAIIVDEVDPLSAIVRSIKGLQQTYIEVIGFIIYFGIVAFFFIPLFLGLLSLIQLSIKWQPTTDLIAIMLGNAFGLFLLLIQYVGRTLLYLYSKKELPASYFEK